MRVRLTLLLTTFGARSTRRGALERTVVAEIVRNWAPYRTTIPGKTP